MDGEHWQWMVDLAGGGYLGTSIDTYDRDLFLIGTYAFPDNEHPYTINSVGITVFVNPSHEGDGYIKLCVKTYGVVYESTEIFVAQSVTGFGLPFSFVWTVNPHTNKNWTLSELNSMQVGISMKVEGDNYGFRIQNSTHGQYPFTVIVNATGVVPS